MAERRLKHWGWGYEDQAPTATQLREAAEGIRARFGFGGEVEKPVALEEVELRDSRLKRPSEFGDLFSDGRYERVSHALGSAYRDVVRGFYGKFENPPDLVAFPKDESEIETVLSWAEAEGAAVIPFGGGTSVCGGVEPRLGERTSVSLDLRRLDRVLEVDPTSLAARIQAGATGPGLEDQLREYGLTLRHFPQSFEYSTLSGWVATRAGGHFATLETHIDDLVESVRALTPRGVWESRRLPGSGAGPSPDRLLLGSEGILGVITQAWVRVQQRPTFRASVGVHFPGFAHGAAAVRALSQAGLHPAGCRLLDPGEAAITRSAPDGKALLVLAFESADHPLEPWMERALECCGDHRGTAAEPPRYRSAADPGERGAGVDAWRSAFLQAPYLRDTMVAAGILSETFETAMTWDRLGDFVETVGHSAREALHEVYGAGSVTCRFTHVYPDGAAPYFTLLAPARRGSELEQWDEVKAAASDAVIAAGGTITHHHAVGRDHRPWYDRQRPDPFADALRAAKAALDPAGILNPGVLIDPA